MQGNGNIRGFLCGAALAVLAGINFKPAASVSNFIPAAPAPNPVVASPEQIPEPKLDVYIDTYVTGYNTVAAQTDDDPCIAASGANICGRRNTIACPPLLPLGTAVEIRGRTYVCEDRMASRFRDRFDIRETLKNSAALILDRGKSVTWPSLQLRFWLFSVCP